VRRVTCIQELPSRSKTSKTLVKQFSCSVYAATGSRPCIANTVFKCEATMSWNPSGKPADKTTASMVSCCQTNCSEPNFAADVHQTRAHPCTHGCHSSIVLPDFCGNASTKRHAVASKHRCGALTKVGLHPLRSLVVALNTITNAFLFTFFGMTMRKGKRRRSTERERGRGITLAKTRTPRTGRLSS
jgi:hypothetical protein